MTHRSTTTNTIPYTNQHTKHFFTPPSQAAAEYALKRLKNERSEPMLGLLVNRRPQDDKSWSTRKFKLQNKAKRLLPGHSIQKCCCWSVPAKNVEIWKSEGDGSAHYRNVQTCKNVWVCPVCSSRITERRAKELQAMLDGTDYQTVMVTYTMRHNRTDTLVDTLETISSAIRSFKSGRKWQGFKEGWGIVGTIKALEVTWSYDNGWHPHIHELIVLDLKKPLSYAQTAHLDDILTERWLRVLSRHGGSATSERGLTVSPNAIDQYIAKFGRDPKGDDGKWTLAREVAKAASKHNSKGKSLTPFEILDRSGDDKQMSALFVEYQQAMIGKRQMVWSKGLRDLLELVGDGDEMADEKGGEKLIEIPFSHWQSVYAERKRGDLLKIAQTGTIEDIRLFVNVCHYRQLAKIEPNAQTLMHKRHKAYGRHE